ncbi:substrate-binding periplasmic protein [Spartinivicinus poritis]|uniref:Transporter substrate-binding domain-containing protein n=1 Tax=Spartinivicinus poritis TaxID=2994640 RepID=A0ABT5UFT7_9GAMM|nr:transporter substrate-binding domain-containing protein [Spartinivicinus sp. A2-2]MDE1465251.1 transporter substrate-binding domain-containing protein [Spartinivicinus sp. A2-2]
MKLCSLCLVILILVATLHNEAGGDTLSFNTQDFPPFSYEKQGRVEGAGAEIIRAVCNKMQISCTIRLLPWRRAQEEAKKGKVNGLFMIGKNKVREKWLYFSSPIIETQYGFFVRKNDNLNYQELSNIAGYQVGVYGPSNTSYTLETIKSQMLKQEIFPIKITFLPDDIGLFKMLDKGRVIESVFSNKAVGFEIIKNNNLERIRYAGSYKKLYYYVGLSKQYTPKSVVDSFNNRYFELCSAGVIGSILDRFELEKASL